MNIEYEVDELRRGMKIRPELVSQGGIERIFIHGKLLVEPGTLFTQQEKHGGSAGDTRPSSGYPEDVPRRGDRRDRVKSECTASYQRSANEAFLRSRGYLGREVLRVTKLSTDHTRPLSALRP